MTNEASLAGQVMTDVSPRQLADAFRQAGRITLLGTEMTMVR